VWRALQSKQLDLLYVPHRIGWRLATCSIAIVPHKLALFAID